MKARFLGAKNKRGIRGAVYREAELKGAGYMPPPSQSIWYDDGSDDLRIEPLFRNYLSCAQFRAFLSQWYLNHPLVVKQGDVQIESGTWYVYMYINEDDWKAVLLRDCGCGDYDSPLQTLEQLFEVHSSESSALYSVALDNNFRQFQSIESQKAFVCVFPIKCHIVPKSECNKTQLKDDPNNMLALSGPAYHHFDGINTVIQSTGETNLPLIAIKPPESLDNLPKQLVGDPVEPRTRVDVSVRCLNEEVGKYYTLYMYLKEGSTKVSSTEWKVSLFVTNAETFCACLKKRYEKTMSIWRNHEDER